MNFEEFNEYVKRLKKQRLIDRDFCHEEKIRQLMECINLQSKIDQHRLVIDENREAIRRRFFEAEKQRRVQFSLQEKVSIEDEKVKAKTKSKTKEKKFTTKKKT